MKLTRREFVAIAGLLALGGCGSAQTEEPTKEATPEPEEPEQEKPSEDVPVFDHDVTLAVMRCDIRHGALGEWEGLAASTTDFADSYAQVSADGNLNFRIDDVVFNGKCSLGDETTTQFSGQSDYPAVRVLLNGDEYATVGGVDLEAFLVDQYLVIDMVMQEDTPEHSGTLFANYYLAEQMSDE